MAEKSQLKCCRYCGRDTRANDAVCHHCRGGYWKFREGGIETKGRKSMNREQMESLDSLEDAARNEDEGWPYDDDDEFNAKRGRT